GYVFEPGGRDTVDVCAEGARDAVVIEFSKVLIEAAVLLHDPDDVVDRDRGFRLRQAVAGECDGLRTPRAGVVDLERRRVRAGDRGIEAHVDLTRAAGIELDAAVLQLREVRAHDLDGTDRHARGGCVRDGDTLRNAGGADDLIREGEARS